MHATTRLRLSKATLAAGAIALTIAVLSTHLIPATGYELSIYQATPSAFWIGLFVTLAATVVLAFASDRRSIRVTALWLAGLAIVAFAALPLLRGYQFFGPEDALTHLGHTKSLVRDTVDLTTIIYPAMHTLAALLGILTTRPFTWSLLLTVPLFVAIFILFVPLCVRLIVARTHIDPIAVVSALLLLPIAVIYLPVLQPIPTSEAILFVPAVTFILLAYTRRPRRLAFGTLLVIALAFLVVLHPQHGLVFGALLGIVLVTQFVAQPLTRTVSGPKAIARLFVQFIVLAGIGLAVVWGWLSTQSLFGRGVSELGPILFDVETTAQLQTFLSTHSFDAIIAELLDTPARPIIPRSNTLEALGVSVRTIYRRTFAVEIVVGVFAVLALLVPVLSKAANRRHIRYSVVLSLVCGIVPAVILTVLYVLAGNPLQYFRYLGFVLVFVTILGAVFLWEARATLETWLPSIPVRSVLAVGFVVLLLVSSFTMFRSPYVAQETDHVPEGQMTGYEFAFDHKASDTGFAGVSSSFFRYRDGIAGKNASDIPQASLDDPRGSGRYLRVPYHFADQELRTQSDELFYLPVTAVDRQSSTQLYGGVEFSQNDFTYLNSTPGIANTYANGQFDLYRIEPANETDS
ncbi:hypothetical protein [Halococcus thailandensis]|uniref:Glycosyltransferase RgtA/B/C/D-like domain-containing protein n=1 Tax=Halococcus thailandensis JCM 13552 TaxID=1227457 RepID=M0MR79_9EURY|nr:hypothetical protein [Halococcus thailandensis]EMA48232.1 hypothetical protein C451_20597 [Halococcus thailandensis JCM 13552]